MSSENVSVPGESVFDVAIYYFNQARAKFRASVAAASASAQSPQNVAQAEAHARNELLGGLRLCLAAAVARAEKAERERDEARAALAQKIDSAYAVFQRANAAEAEVARLKAALSRTGPALLWLKVPRGDCLPGWVAVTWDERVPVMVQGGHRLGDGEWALEEPRPTSGSAGVTLEQRWMPALGDTVVVNCQKYAWFPVTEGPAAPPRDPRRDVGAVVGSTAGGVPIVTDEAVPSGHGVIVTAPQPSLDALRAAVVDRDAAWRLASVAKPWNQLAVDTCADAYTDACLALAAALKAQGGPRG